MKKLKQWKDNMPAWSFRRAINLWPPFWGAGIHVEAIAEDFRHVEVSLKLRWYNQNYIGTHFGGSMFAMTDPFYMLMLIKNLGKAYIVWDKAASINFIKPGKGTLRAIFNFTGAELAAVRHEADEKGKIQFDRSVDIINAEGETVAEVVKTLYVRRKDANKQI